MSRHSQANARDARVSLWQVIRTRDNAWAALKVSAVVGTVLNLLNNGPAWWQGDAVSVWKVLLNYLVPYCVSSYSAARNQVQAAADRPEVDP
ncbi:MAG: nitrate/nitrite transporter NrtS [Burkholderiaceae bacterium]|jgi:hypothetical protein|nr:nitrate/nitrite transporter NrtS [Burkholderiaceae bacterium]MCU0963483.1 nitrate/nitrite transporter NrtS [Burkholderiaceae bacterium]